MGCLCSREEDKRDRNASYIISTRQIPEHTLKVIQPVQLNPSQSRPLHGDFQCSCGRFWRSRMSWENAYQICKRCKRRVNPTNQRALRPEDMVFNKDVAEHPKELCQKCQELGRYCGRSEKPRHRY